MLGLLTCSGLQVSGASLLTLLLLVFRGRLVFSSPATDRAGSLKVSEDSSMYARFSPKKSSSWQSGEAAVGP